MSISIDSGINDESSFSMGTRRYFRSALGSDLLPGDVDDIPVLAEHCSYRLLVSAMNRQPNNVKADSLPLPRPDHSICRRRKQESLQVFCPTRYVFLIAHFSSDIMEVKNCHSTNIWLYRGFIRRERINIWTRGDICIIFSQNHNSPAWLFVQD